MTDLLDMAWDRLYEASEKVAGMPSEEKFEIGSKALEELGDYPLYASKSNISYEEAILIALVIEGDDFMNYIKEAK